MTIDDAVSSIDNGFLILLDILGLGLRDFDLRLQFRRIRHASQVVANLNALADLNRQLLQHAGHSRAHMQRLHLVHFQLGELLRLIDRRLFRSDLRLNRITGESQAFLFDLVAVGQLRFFHLGCFVNQLSHETVLGQLIVRLPFHLGLFELGVNSGRRRFLVEKLTLQRRTQGCQLGFSAGGLRFGIMGRLFELRAAQLQNHGVGLHRRAGPDDYFFDAAFRRSRNPANVFRHERPQSAHLTNHWSAFHRIDPNRRAIHARHGRFQTRQCKSNENQAKRGAGDDHDAALFLFPGNVRTRLIHRGNCRSEAGRPHDCVFGFRFALLHGVGFLDQTAPIAAMKCAST